VQQADCAELFEGEAGAALARERTLLLIFPENPEATHGD
jgi:hypothetical protein